MRPDRAVTVRLAEPADLPVCFAIRREVFILEQAVSEADEFDGLDGVCDHLLALRGPEAAGTTRLRWLGDTLKIQRVAVRAPHRGFGVGDALIRRALHEAQERSTRRVTLGAQVHALEFYRRHGFAPLGPRYDEAGIEHQEMARDL